MSLAWLSSVLARLTNARGVGRTAAGPAAPRREAARSPDALSGADAREAIHLNGVFRIRHAREILRRSSQPRVGARSESALITVRSDGRTIPPPPLLCFDNHWQPQYSPALCGEPMRAADLSLPVVANARLVGNGVVLMPDDVILAESVGRHAARLGLEPQSDGTCRLAKRARLAIHRWLKHAGATRHDCTGLLLFHPAIAQYGVWVLKTIPKLAVLDVVDDPDVRIVVPAGLPEKYVDQLIGLGIDARRIVFHDTRGVTLVRTLIVPPKVYSFRRSRLGNPFSVFSRVGYAPDAAGSAPGPRGRRLYVTRRDNPRRRLVNEPEVQALFRELGFTVVDPAGFTAAETFSVFGGCDFVAGPSGSGLFNVLFSNRRFKALVLVPPRQKFERQFLMMADICAGKGGSVGYVFGRHVSPDGGASGDRFDYDWEVDLPALRRVVTDLAGSRQ